MESFKNRKLDVTKPVEMYRCLNRKGFVFSIRQNGLVIGHTSKIVLKNCKLIVNQAGKQRSIETHSRNVHAFIKGLIGEYNDIKLSFSYLVNYNPFSNENFVINGKEVDNCNLIYLQENKIYAQMK
jgi:hypothetical protein